MRSCFLRSFLRLRPLAPGLSPAGASSCIPAGVTCNMPTAGRSSIWATRRGSCSTVRRAKRRASVSKTAPGKGSRSYRPSASRNVTGCASPMPTATCRLPMRGSPGPTSVISRMWTKWSPWPTRWGWSSACCPHGATSSASNGAPGPRSSQRRGVPRLSGAIWGSVTASGGISSGYWAATVLPKGVNPYCGPSPAALPAVSPAARLIRPA